MQHFSTSSNNLSDLKGNKIHVHTSFGSQQQNVSSYFVHKVSMEFSFRENKSLQFYVSVTIRQDKFQYKAQLIDTKKCFKCHLLYLERNISTASALSG